MRGSAVWLTVLAMLAATIATAEAPSDYRQGTERFAAEMMRKHGLSRAELDALIGDARYSQEVIDAIRRPWEAKPWYQYRALFLTDKRIAGGVEFWRANAELLERARAAYGVPPEIIVAIIGVETNYGANLGKHRVIDALSTLGFSYPPRADFFRKELEHFLLLAREEKLPAATLVGSYAGAMGKAQFIPSSYRAYAIDFDGDGRRDLWGSDADAIGSVANYFRRHGWRAGEPVAVPVGVPARLPAGIAAAEGKPKKPDTTVARLRAAGISGLDGLSPTAPAGLIRLAAPQDEYWAGLDNFYVITRYNHSNLYAMAVYQLSGEIRETYQSRFRDTAARH